jgi:hypothetical protein
VAERRKRVEGSWALKRSWVKLEFETEQRRRWLRGTILTALTRHSDSSHSCVRPRVKSAPDELSRLAAPRLKQQRPGHQCVRSIKVPF